MEHIALRVFTREQTPKKKSTPPKKPKMVNFSRVLTFDAETSANEYLNLKFGSFTVHENDVSQYKGLFWDDRHVSEKSTKF